MTDRPEIQGVVLAGGDSERFGREDKALAELEGRPLLAHVLDAVGTVTDKTPILAVATREEGQRLRGGLDRDAIDLTVVTDDPALDGPLAGFVAAAERADAQWLLVCGCDMPLVTPEAVGALVDHLSDGVDAVVPVVDGHDQPMLAVYDRDRVLELAPDLGGLGPRALIDSLPRVVRVDAADIEAPLARAVTNVNTRADLDAVREQPGSEE